jgi:diaminopimelate epimerase
LKRFDFVKMVGHGNDFIVGDNRKGLIGKDTQRTAVQLCDRKHSIGADGLVLLEKSKIAHLRMRIINPDGSEAEMCGNGVRCLAKFANDKKIAGKKISIETMAGRIDAEVKGDVVKAKMVQPTDFRMNISLPLNGSPEAMHFVNTGVPHAVVVLNSIKDVDVDKKGRMIRQHPYFSPRGTNANFISIRSGNAIEIRTYERGVEGETLSCGTGSTAGALVAAAIKNLKSPVTVHTKGGEPLKIYFSRNENGFFDVYLEGRVQTSFEGRINL